MRSMNKYGVILIGGTIGSVVAGGNCSGKGKENENEKNFKKFVCECFTGVSDSDFLEVIPFNDTTVSNNYLNDLVSKVKDREKIKSATHILTFFNGDKSFAGFIKLGAGKELKCTGKVTFSKDKPLADKSKKGFFHLIKGIGGAVGFYTINDEDKATV